MPSGAKRRKAAKKKKEKQRVISHGNGEVKVIESDGGENSSPASQDMEPPQNPFSKDENQGHSGPNESMENKKDGEVAGEAESENDEKGGIAGVIHAPKSLPVEISVGSAAAELKPKKTAEKVKLSETFSDFGEASEETTGKQLRQSNIHIGNGEWQRAEKEPLLLKAPTPVKKTSWTCCCGLLELFSGSGR